jgi:hypothetical protein
MSLFNWLFGNTPPAPSQATASQRAVASAPNLPTRPALNPRPEPVAAQPAAVASLELIEQRRSERNARRELLFQAVRESMVRVGVLSSSFKFKVLSLDQRGRSFLVMIELSAEFSGEVEKLSEIENTISNTAKQRFDIVVQAVYWRYFQAQTAVKPSAHAPTSAPAPLLSPTRAPTSLPAPLQDTSRAAPAAESASDSSTAFMSTMPAALENNTPTPPVSSRSFQTTAAATGSFPIIGATAEQKAAGVPSALKQDDLSDAEVAAFKRALAYGAAQGKPSSFAPLTGANASAATSAATSATGSGASPSPVSSIAAASAITLEQARSKLLLTGYEDTEMHDEDPAPALSVTQYGDLR